MDSEAPQKGQRQPRLPGMDAEAPQKGQWQLRMDSPGVLEQRVDAEPLQSIHSFAWALARTIRRGKPVRQPLPGARQGARGAPPFPTPLGHCCPARSGQGGCLPAAALPYLRLRKSEEPQHCSSPLAMMAMRSPSRSASSMKCVVSRMVRWLLCCCSRSQVALREAGSIPDVGSSSITTCGQAGPRSTSAGRATPKRPSPGVRRSLELAACRGSSCQAAELLCSPTALPS